MKNGKTLMTFVVLVVAFASVAGAGEKVLIKQRFAPGAYLTTTKMVTDQTINVNNMPQPPQHIEMLMAMKTVISKPDAKGFKKMVITYERIKQEMKMGATAISYDSSGPKDKQNPILSQTVGVLLKAKIEATIDRDGKIVKVGGLNELWDKMGEQNEMMKPMMAKMKKEMGDAMIEKMIMQGQVMLPKKPVGVGETWKNDLEMGAPIIGKIKMSLDCKLDSIITRGGAKIAVISFNSTAKGVKPSETKMMGMKMIIHKFDMKQKGKAEVDTDNSMSGVVNVDQTGDIDMAITNPNGQKIPMKINQKVRMTTTTVPYVAKKAVPAPVKSKDR